MFKLTIATENAAFGDAECEVRSELARILRHIATTLERRDDADYGRVGDHNGNHVGDWTLTS